MRIVVAGAGLAGYRAAQAARAAGHTGELTLVGDERHPPYTRPPLSKELLAGLTDACELPGVDGLEATWRLDTPAVGLDAAAHTLALGDGGTLDYDRLIIATGCRARPLGGRGSISADLAGVHLLRGLDDARALRAALAGRPRLAIIGAGFVGCEVAATARGADVPVTLIDVAEQPMVPLGPELGARCAALHRDHGVDVRLGCGVDGLRGEAGRVTGVRLADGSVIDAELVLVALGAVPNTEWLRGSAIVLDAAGGVVCDATLTTSDPDVLAAGDVAAWAHPAGDRDRIRVEHWTTAAEHGRVAGANAVAEAGARAVHATPPYFWSDQYDVKIQSVGIPARAARIEIIEEGDGRLAAEAYGGDGRLVGAVTFNHAKRLAEYRRRLAAESAAGPARADDTPPDALREPVTS